jgi:hypothetical protein
MVRIAACETRIPSSRDDGVNLIPADRRKLKLIAIWSIVSHLPDIRVVLRGNSEEHEI